MYNNEYELRRKTNRTLRIVGHLMGIAAWAFFGFIVGQYFHENIWAMLGSILFMSFMLSGNNILTKLQP